MNILPIIIFISFFWVVSEITLGIMKRSKEETTKKLDKASLTFLWITIMFSTFTGVFIGISRIGQIQSGRSILSVTGLILIILGLIIRWIAILTLRKYFTVNVSIARNQMIINKSVYRYIRHPSYAGSLLSFLGLGLALSNWLSTLIIVMPIFAAYRYRIRVEEEALIGAFGNDYLEYASKTRRLIPGIY